MRLAVQRGWLRWVGLVLSALCLVALGWFVLWDPASAFRNGEIVEIRIKSDHYASLLSNAQCTHVKDGEWCILSGRPFDVVKGALQGQVN